MTIEITTQHPSSRHGVPVCLLDGQQAADADGFKACLKALRWRVTDAAERTGKAESAISAYRRGLRPVPAEVWNVLRDAMEGR